MISRRATLVLLACILGLSGCGLWQAASAVAGGPKVAANVNAGQSNVQSAGKTHVDNTSLKLIRPKARRILQSHDVAHVKADQIKSLVVHEAAPELKARLEWWYPTPGGFVLWPLLMFLRRKIVSFTAPQNQERPYAR